MRRRATTRVLATLAIAMAGSWLLAPRGAAAQPSPYLDHDALTSELEELADSDFAQLTTLTTSLEGREVWLLEVRNPGGTPAAERPAVLVVGNLEGDHVVGSHLVLEMGRHLLGGAPALDSILSDHVFYLIPRLNPDGAEAFFAPVRADVRGNRRPFDDDNDGRIDEDPPEDLNGDGLVTFMRVADPLGTVGLDPDDGRFLLPASPGERRAGAYSVYWEGVDSDGDGFLNEDGLGGVDLNRNFQHEYPYYQRDVGPHMVSELESRALMDFVIAHRNIAAILTFGHSDNLVTPPDDDGELANPRVPALPGQASADLDEALGTGVYGATTPTGGLDLRGVQPGADNDPASGQRPAVVVNAQDRAYFEAASELYREVTGIERVGMNRRAEGAFFQYGYYHYGVPSFSTQGWGLPEPAEAGDEEADEESGSDSDEAELLRDLDASGIDAWVDWTPFQHPDLGAVEIGGFRPYAMANPPAEQLAGLGEAHGRFLVELAGLLPRVRIVETEVESHGGGVYTVSAEVENSGFLPTAMRHGVVAGSVDPVTVRIGIPLESLITGDDLSPQVSQLAGSGSRERFEWVIRGTPGSSIEIRVRSQKGGAHAVNVTLGGE